MIIRENNYAFIDSQNVNLGIRAQGWMLSFKRFRKYLQEKYSVTRAYIFIGYVEGNRGLYTALQNSGFVCIFKPTLESKDGKIKGNCDAELVLQSMIDLNKYDKAVIISGDGDFYCLISYLIDTNKIKNVLIPNQTKFSSLLKNKKFEPYLRYMNNLRNKIEYKKEKAL